MPSRSLNSIESSTLPRDEYGEGIVTASTFSLPSASAASAVTTAESMPPDNPRSAFVKLFLRA